MTNADKIRAMSDEQLAAVCAEHTYYQESAWSQPTYGGAYGDMCYTKQEAVDSWLEWLKLPMQED